MSKHAYCSRVEVLDFAESYWKNRCAYCGRIRTKSGVSRTTLDHFIPKAKIKSNNPMIMVPCCWACNQSKRDCSPVKWINKNFSNSDEVFSRLGEYFTLVYLLSPRYKYQEETFRKLYGRVKSYLGAYCLYTYVYANGSERNNEAPMFGFIDL